MAVVSRHINSSRESFYEGSFELVRARVQVESAIGCSEERRAIIRSAIRDLFRGRPLLLSEFRLSGRGATGLFDALREQTLSSVRSFAHVCAWLNFAVRLFEPLPLDQPSFFDKMATVAESMLGVERYSVDVTIAFLRQRCEALTREFTCFYRGLRLLRPQYDASWFTSSSAITVLAELQRSAEGTRREAETQQRQLEVQQQVMSILAQHRPQPAPAVVAGAPAVPGQQGQPPQTKLTRQQKRAKKAQELAQQQAQQPAQPAQQPPPQAQQPPPQPPAQQPPAAPPLPLPQPVAPPWPPMHMPMQPMQPMPGQPMHMAPPAVQQQLPGFVPVGAPPPQAPAQRVPAVNPHGVMGGPAHVGIATREQMKLFSEANLAPDGKQRCFNFFRRGTCNPGSACRFAHY